MKQDLTQIATKVHEDHCFRGKHDINLAASEALVFWHFQLQPPGILTHPHHIALMVYALMFYIQDPMLGSRTLPWIKLPLPCNPRNSKSIFQSDVRTGNVWLKNRNSNYTYIYIHIHIYIYMLYICVYIHISYT